MQQVSEKFWQEQKRSIMGPAALKVELTAADVEASASAVGTASSESAWSRTDTPLGKKGAEGPGIAVLEPQRLKADGTQKLAAPALAGAEGWVSRQMSGGDCVYSPPPVYEVTVDPDRPARAAALTFWFDRAAEEGPALIRVTALLGKETVLRREYAPVGDTFETPDAFRGFDRLRVEFLKSQKPFRRVRLCRLVLGRCLEFLPGQIASASRKASADPIGRRLPAGSFCFETLNLPGPGWYDPEEPTGLWPYLESRSPIRVQLGQKLTGEGVEWLEGGEYYLTGKPRVEGMTVRFEAEDALSLLQKPFYKGIWTGKEQNLYDLAKEVLLDSELCRLWPGQTPWVLWEGLKGLFTKAPLPVRPGRECLQLIAHAAGCVLYCDRLGRVVIEPQNQEKAKRTLPLFEQFEEGSKADKNPALAKVDCPYRVIGCEAQPRQLHQGEYKVNGSTKLHLEYPAAAEVQIEVTGAELAHKAVYAAACDLELLGSGTAKLTLTGKALQESLVAVSEQGPALPGTGEIETVNNPLITDPETAQRTARWVKEELCRRTVYTRKTRGHVQLDPLDPLLLNTKNTKGLKVRLLENRLEYSGGALSSTLILKRQEEKDALADTQNKLDGPGLF